MKFLLFMFLLSVFSCASKNSQPKPNPIVSNPNVADPNQIVSDKNYCRDMAKNTIASQGAGGGTAGGALKGAATSAASGAAAAAIHDSDVKKSAGVSAAMGALTGAAIRKKKNKANIANLMASCLQKKGYAILSWD